MDYAPEVNGDVSIAHYTAEPRIRRVRVPDSPPRHRRNPDASADLDQTAITIDITDVPAR
jgi:hypothetical protein